MQELIIHPAGETEPTRLNPVSESVTVETFDGRIHVDWNSDAAIADLKAFQFKHRLPRLYS